MAEGPFLCALAVFRQKAQQLQERFAALIPKDIHFPEQPAHPRTLGPLFHDPF